ncbi:MAG: polymer-forming cytoskeletal protein [Bacteroidetes bacterium]|nr:polymer-forming cytoskeletal protein [Bacteroidota bacterium]
MFSGSKNNMPESTNSSNIIGKETIIEGNITTSGNVRVEGKLIGNLTTKSKAVLGNDSRLEGKIVAQNAEIAGTLEGVIEVTELLILKPTAIVNGDIITKKLVFEKDAKFNGKCIMNSETQVQNHLKKDYDKKEKERISILQ